MHNAAKNTDGQVFIWTQVLGRYLGVKLVGHMVTLRLIFLRRCHIVCHIFFYFFDHRPAFLG